MFSLPIRTLSRIVLVHYLTSLNLATPRNVNAGFFVNRPAPTFPAHLGTLTVRHRHSLLISGLLESLLLGQTSKPALETKRDKPEPYSYFKQSQRADRSMLPQTHPSIHQSTHSDPPKLAVDVTATANIPQCPTPKPNPRSIRDVLRA